MRLKPLAIFGAVVACGVAAAAAWGLLRGTPAETVAQISPEQTGRSDEPVVVDHGSATDDHADDVALHENDASLTPSESGPDSRGANPHESPPTADYQHGDDNSIDHEEGPPPGFASPRENPDSPTELSAEKRTHRTTAELVRADSYFRQGDLAMAMKVYGTEIQQSGPTIDPVVYFRWALCAESLGILDDALTRYQALANNTSSPAWRGFALWGQGRVLQQQGRIELAVRIASEICITQDESATLWRPEMMHWFGQLLCHRAFGMTSVDLLDPEALVECRWTFRTSDLLAICSQIHATELTGGAPLPEEAPTGASAARQPAAEAIRLSLKRGSVADVIKQVAAAAHKNLEFSPAAESLAAVRMCRASCSAGPELLLDCLCDPAGLAWRIDDDRIQVRVYDELPPDDRKTFQCDIATRRLRDSLVAEPLHPWASHSQFGLGQLARVGGDAAGAQAVFKELITSFPQSPLLGETWFNLGKLHVRAGEIPSAIDAFERCVDNAAGTPLEPVADLYLGRMLLESEEPARAVLALRRAAALAPPEFRPQATLTLAAAHLAAGHPGQANEVLRVAESELNKERFRDAAAFLSALSQVRAARDPWRLKIDQRSLVAALSHVRTEDIFGWQGAALIGAAYFELGLPSEGAAVCRHAVEQMPDCPLRSRLQLLLVDDAGNRGEFSRAESMLRDLISTKQKQTCTASYRRLCRLLLDAGRIDDAQRACLEWLDSSDSAADQSEALRHLGRCLERKGDRLNAALCYAGARPNLSTESTVPAAFPALPEVGTPLQQPELQKEDELTRNTGTRSN